MIALVQRVNHSSVSINSNIFSQIDTGLLILLGINKGDKKQDAKYLSKKIVDLRIFSDEANKMNLNIKNIEGSILVVSQFTLCGNLQKGNRPSFINAAKKDLAKPLYEYFIKLLKEYKINVQTGKFGAEMELDIVNNGPVTLIINSKK